MRAAPSGCSARRERSGLRAIWAGEATAHEGRAAVSIHCSERRSGALPRVGPGTEPGTRVRASAVHVTIERATCQSGMNEIVITGSTGVIGRRAVRELLAAGHRVTGVT